MKTDIYDRALEFAVKHYGGRMRKDNDTPMLLHALRAVEILRNDAGIEDRRILSCALLHDVLEESFAKRDDIDKLVDPHVGAIVAALTEDKRLVKAMRKKSMLDSVADMPDEAKIVKLADRLDNIRSSWLRESAILRRYTAECKTILKHAKGVCPPLEAALRDAVKKLDGRGARSAR